MKLFFGFLSALVLVGCKSEPKPIRYNLDTCEFCQMVITDPRYGTEILTDKGKAYKFDSFECLIDYTKETKPEIDKYLVTSFDKPKQLIDGSTCFVLQCEAMPSPMGRNLTVFSSELAAKKIANEKGGKLLPLLDALNQF